jgi:hypothetical protein
MRLMSPKSGALCNLMPPSTREDVFHLGHHRFLARLWVEVPANSAVGRRVIKMGRIGRCIVRLQIQNRDNDEDEESED